MTTTPPITDRIATPPAPLHGPKYDSPRRSSRINTKQMHSPRIPAASPSRPRKRAIKPTSSQTLSPPSSPASPGYRTSLPRSFLHKRAHDTYMDAPSYGLMPKTHKSDTEDLLPTPAKTPRKRPVADAKISSTARVLLNDHPTDPKDIMPTPRKSRKARKHIAFSLESFEKEKNGERQVEVFTDSKEHIPEIDDDDENPFIVRKGKRRAAMGSPTGESRTPRRSKNGMTKEVDEAVENGQGMVYTFRGKKVYRPFSDAHDHEATANPTATLPDPAHNQEVLHRAIGAAVSRPFTRSSIKPRLLFPPPAEPQPNSDDLADEEADTDIDTSPSPKPVIDPQTATQAEAEADGAGTAAPAATPRKVKAAFLPMTPPTTQRKKRSSPFDSWSRVKSLRSVSAPKRSGEDLEREEPAGGKRTRSGQAEPSL